MPQLTFTTKYRKNEGVCFSTEEIYTLYLYGVDVTSKDGSKLDSNTIKLNIKSAQKEVEKYLDIKLFPTFVEETKDYYRDDYYNGFPFVRTSLPVKKVLSLVGRLNNVEQILYPESWLSEKKTTDQTYYRQFSIVPSGTTVEGNADVIFTGVSSNYGLRAFNQVSNYWTVQYETGFDIGELPEDLLQMIGQLSAIPLLAIAGDLILGAGISSQSLSIDGLSQSISSTSSATNAGYGARIIEYRKSIDQTKKALKRYYKGVTFAAL